MTMSCCAGSHVVIKSTDDNLNKKFPETVADAALLAAHRSKNKLEDWCDVKLTRCKYVKKIPGSPPGQVLILDVTTLAGKNVFRVDMKKTRARFQQLEKERLNRQQGTT